MQRWVRDIRSRVPDAKILFVGNGLLTETEERQTCAALTSMVQQYESHRQKALQTQLDQLRSIIDSREQARRANPQQSLRGRGWRAMKTMVATTAKRNAEQVTAVQKQLSTQLQFLNGARPLLVSASTGKDVEELKAVLTGCLPQFLHFGAPVPQQYVQLQRHFEETQAGAFSQTYGSILAVILHINGRTVLLESSRRASGLGQSRCGEPRHLLERLQGAAHFSNYM